MGESVESRIWSCGSFRSKLGWLVAAPGALTWQARACRAGCWMEGPSGDTPSWTIAARAAASLEGLALEAVRERHVLARRANSY